MMNQDRGTHAEMLAEAKSTAQWVEDNDATLNEAVIALKRSHNYIWKCCIRFGVRPRRADGVGSGFSFNTYKILKGLLDGIPIIELAIDYNITRERINNIKIQAKKAGFVFPE